MSSATQPRHRTVRSGAGMNSPGSFGLDRALVAVVRRPRRRLVLLLVAGFGLALALALQTTALLSGRPLPMLLDLLHGLAVLAGFGGVGLVATHAMGRTSEPRPHTLWALVLVVAVAFVFGILLEWMLVPGGIPPDERAGFGFLKNGAPASPRTLLLMLVASLVGFVVALFVLVRLRDFVLWRRTPLAARFWRWLVAGLVVNALATEFVLPYVAEPWQTYLDTGMGIAVAALIGLNVVRLSWIVYLTFREKLFTLITVLALVAVIVAINVKIAPSADAADTVQRTFNTLVSGPFAERFSPGLAAFTKGILAFGMIYGLAAFLLLVFHLPTSTDFERREGGRMAFTEFSRLIGQAFNTQQLADAIVEASVKGGVADRAWLALVDETSLAPVVVAAENVPVEDAAKVVDASAFLADLSPERLPVQLDEALADLRVRHRLGVPVGSLLAVPLVAREGDVLGMLFAARTEPFGFASDDRKALQGVAAQAALALDHARLFKSRVEKERLERELDIARSVQQRLLPQQLPQLPRVDLYASSVPALEVGGDYYDALVLDDGRLGLIVADVSGKGTSAAFYMAEMKGVFRAVARDTASPSAFLRRAHRALTLAPGTFVSALYALFDPESGTVTLARAGHCPALHVHEAGGPPALVRPSGLGLGLDHGGAFDRVLRETTVALGPGDALVLYTDGLVESRNPEGEEYGYERLVEAASCHRCQDASRLHRAILGDLHDFLRGEPYADDLTLLVLVWLGPVGHNAPPSATFVPSDLPLTL